MKQLGLCLLACLVLQATLSCDVAEPVNECGVMRASGTSIYGGSWGTGFVPCVPLASQTNFANEPGAQASVSWKLELKNICTKEHSRAEVNFKVREEVAEEVSFKALIWYAILKERPMTLTKSNDGTTVQWEGNDEFGVRDAYGDGPGEFFIFVDMFFPSTGYWESDSAFVDENLVRLHIDATVSEFK